MKLWIIRHAKSDWSSRAASDFERPLNPRGQRDGPRMAEWLGAEPDPPTWIWTSDAARALATAGYVEDAFRGANPVVVQDHRLYGATPETLLSVLRETPADRVTAAVIAHNPGLTQFANLLAGESVTENIPTFGVVRLRLPAPWADLRFGQARLELFTSPKRLPV